MPEPPRKISAPPPPGGRSKPASSLKKRPPPKPPGKKTRGPPPKPPRRKKKNELADIKDPVGKIHHYCSRGAKDDVEYMVGLDKDLLNAAGAVGNTCLHFAAQAGHHEIVELLIDEGANMEAQNDNKDTPLHLAVWKDRTDAAKVLISKGAKKNVKNKEGKTQFDLVHSKEMRMIVPEFDSEEAKALIVKADDDDEDDDDIDW